MATSGKKSRKAQGAGTPSIPDIKPLNQVQSDYLKAIQQSQIIFGIGSAGTGKTYIAAAYAARELYYKRIDKIILTRPNVETGRGLGFLPGTLEEKYAPYLEPFEQVFTHILGKGFFEYALKSGAIDPKPLGFMRGMTFDNCVVLGDEVQNASKHELHMFLSRIGQNCKMILSGDPNQVDVIDSGLEDATRRLAKIKGVSVVKFSDDDIVRSELCKQIILAYRNGSKTN